MLSDELKYEQGRREQIHDIQNFIHESIKKYGESSVSAVVETHNDLIQYLHMENSRWTNSSIARLLQAIESPESRIVKEDTQCHQDGI